MALSTERKQELLAMNLPPDEVIRELTENFLSVSGYTRPELAMKINYAPVSLGLFLRGRYDENHPHADNSLEIRARLTEFIEKTTGPMQWKPFGKMYPTAAHRAIRAAFYKAVDKGWAYCVYGPPGTQKTEILRYLIYDLQTADAAKNGHGRRAYYVYCKEKSSPTDLLRRICLSAGIPARGDMDHMLRKIRFHLSSRRSLLVLDEAQHLPSSVIEIVRELLDLPPYIGLIFAGSDEIEDKFRELQKAQWRRRMSKMIVLSGLTRDECVTIVRGEIPDATNDDIDDLIKSSSEVDDRETMRAFQDYRKRARRNLPSNAQKKTYLSAGKLFAAIERIKEASA